MNEIRFMLATALVVLAGCASAVAPTPSTPPTIAPSAEWRYALVIDASSSASTLTIYQWRRGPGDRLPVIHTAPQPRAESAETWSHRVRPGLSAYAGRPEEAAASLDPLIDYALTTLPAAEREGATIHLWATAGLRRLETAESDAILAAVAERFAGTPFAATPPRVISGEEEGIYGWLAVNYLLGHLAHGGAFPTVGALDLGGASTQITFVPLDHPREDSGRTVELGGNVYRLYTHSYLGLGQDVVRDELSEPACFLSGYPLAAGGLGSGDFDGCRDAIREHLERPCAAEPCSLFGVYQPPLYGDFLAFSVYAYTADFFELGGRLVPDELAAAGRAFCAQSWTDLNDADPGVAENRFLPLYCFSAAYVVELLTQGFGFPDHSERVHAPLRVQGSDTGWALGALLHEIAGG